MMKQIGKAVLFPGTEDEAWGICETAEVSPEANKKEIPDGAGDTVGLLYTDVGKKKFSGTYTPLAAGSETVTADDIIGSKMTITFASGSTLEIYIDTATLTRKKGDVSEFKIEGYYYPEIDDSESGSGGASGGASGGTNAPAGSGN